MGRKKLLVVVLGLGLLLFGAAMLGRPSDPKPALADRKGEGVARSSAPVTIDASETTRTPVAPVDAASEKPRSSEPKAEDKAVKDYLAAGVLSFFFSIEAWDTSRILASKTFNPRGQKPDEAALAKTQLFVDDALRRIGPMMTEMANASTQELYERAKAGLAREEPPPQVTTAKVRGAEVVEISLSRPQKGDVSVAIGTGNTHVASWDELPKTKKSRADLALTIMEHLVELARLLESQALLTREESDRIVFSAVEVGSSYN